MIRWLSMPCVSFINMALLANSLIISIGILTCGCKTTQEARKVEAAAPEVLVRMQNMDDADGVKTFNFVASDCGQLPSYSGKLLESGSVAFKINGVRSGDKCTIRVENPSASNLELGFKSDQFLMYEAKDVVVGLDLKGHFIATAFLEKQFYFKGNQRFTMTAPVEFEQSIAGAKLTADITCNPPVFLASDNFIANGDRNGDFSFSAVLSNNSQTETSCSHINVFQDKKLVLSGDFKSDSFKPRPGDQVKLSTSAIKLKAAVIAPTGVIVETGTSNTTCKEGEFFNTETRQCEKK